ncbi:membrane-associated proteins in eicosanoid and glutathione metabolism [Mycena belliarum]|uniref:Membrane-associated proteins in eicosanoid and glutathione metabolism n=1 Tax=Mycena belliarum TaxID=1033014 RepID=A0AAD6UAX3_9AGAR|nr:membrane-associated proteins in eicosanoid and glutathione metabolism [Mycena belliae]
MSKTIVLPEGTGYLAGAFLSSALLLVWQGMTVVGGARKRSGVEYPRAYAEKAEMEANPAAVLFNCAQRAHQNTLENLPIIYVMTLITALQRPTLAAGALGLWVVGRVGYTLGYVTGTAKRRTNVLSVVQYPVLIGLLGMSAWTIWDLVKV